MPRCVYPAGGDARRRIDLASAARAPASSRSTFDDGRCSGSTAVAYLATLRDGGAVLRVGASAAPRTPDERRVVG